MLISRLSRVGFRVAKELSRGGYTYLSRARYTQRPCNQYQWSSFIRIKVEVVVVNSNEIRFFYGLNYCQKLEPFKVPYFKSIMVFLPQLPMVLLQEGMKRKKRACEGSLACSTCHVIVMDMEYYNKLEDPTDEENDMLDLAFGLTETSRLGCQIVASPELDGIRLAIPAATRNFAVDGYVPKPH
ncbi:fdxB [Gossypium arboreum]|uniref:FdxB n=1 Tax=Gossypium arboreum TaxID=29729 RepID=A0A0B0NKP9_GOSAR|nr:fdxB [Gossypium arboreum]